MNNVALLWVFAISCLLVDKSCFVQAGQCIMKGLCEKAAFGHIPCVFDGPPSPLTDTDARKDLAMMCPELANEKELCCDAEQINDMKTHAELYGVYLKVCPACLANFQHALCRVVCAPNQAEFVKLLRKTASDNGKEQVSEVDVFMHQNFADGMFASCANITRFNERVIDVFCKPWGAERCNSMRFLRFIGSDFEHQGHSPFQIDYVLSSEDTIQWNGEKHAVTNITPYKCSESVNGQPKCACEHCPASC